MRLKAYNNSKSATIDSSVLFFNFNTYYRVMKRMSNLVQILAIILVLANSSVCQSQDTPLNQRVVASFYESFLGNIHPAQIKVAGFNNGKLFYEVSSIRYDFPFYSRKYLKIKDLWRYRVFSRHGIIGFYFDSQGILIKINQRSGLLFYETVFNRSYPN